jgi:hypothetical protein
MFQLAQLDAAPALDTSKVPALQLSAIQAGGTASVRWLAEHVLSAPRPLHVLLAAVLLVCTAGVNTG